MSGSIMPPLAVGTTAGTVAAGDDARITGALAVTTAASTYAPLTALATETTRATAAETTNTGLINTETTRATNAEATKAPIANPSFTGSILVGGSTTTNGLNVAGFTTLGGNSSNLGNISGASLLGMLNSNGRTLIGWNYSSGSGEVSFLANRGGGTTGGYNFYDFNSSTSVATSLLAISGAGNVAVAGSLTAAGAVTASGVANANGGLNVAGLTTLNGSSANLSTGAFTPAVLLGMLNSNGRTVIGWNYANGGGGGEVAFLANRGGGTTGGYNFYDFNSSTSVTTPLLTISGAGNVAVTGSLTVAGTAMSPYAQVDMFGTGADGTVAMSSGTTTLGRDMHYTNLTMTGTAKIDPAGYRIYVSNVLDLSAAGAGAIASVGYAPGTGVGSAAGFSGMTYWGITVGGARPGSVGPAGTTGAGAAGTSGATSAFNGYAPPVLGGDAGAGGSGGAGAAGAGGAGGAANPLAGRAQYFANTPGLINAISISLSNVAFGSMGSGNGGSGGGSGAGDGTNAGGGAGAGGNSSPVVQIFARFIQRGTNTTAGIIANKSSLGGGGGNAPAGNAGGGGGGSGAGGGGVYIMAESLLGSVIPNAINVSGGAGGAGGNGVGTGKGGNGGTGGNAGSYQTLILSPATFFASAFTTVGSAGGTTTTATGAAGGAPGVLQGNL